MFWFSCINVEKNIDLNLSKYIHKEEDFYKKYSDSIGFNRNAKDKIKKLCTTYYYKNNEKGLKEATEKSINKFLKKKILELINDIEDKNKEQIDINKPINLHQGLLKGRTMCDYQHKHGNYKLFKPKHDFLLPFGGHFSKKDNLIRGINKIWNRYKKGLTLSGPIDVNKYFIFDREWRKNGGPMEPKSTPYECYNKIAELCTTFARENKKVLEH